MSYKKDNKIKSNFTTITISLASPESILERSSGEVLKPETINYRTYKPERDGLFCERIFGPVKDYECHCGKYKRIRYKGIVCDRCGVEVTEKKVRRERMGHINLVVPVAHIWYFRSLPNKIGYLLGLPTKRLDLIIYYERYVVIQPGIKESDGISKMDFLTEEEYLDILDTLPKENQYLDDKDPQKFVAKMGAEALEELLRRINLDELSYNLRHQAANETSQQRKNEALKRLQVVEAFRGAATRIENNPSWMIVKIVPVIPPELRPLVPLEGGRFATSDLNDLYRRVIIRNNRLKRLIEIKAPEVILRNEKRMLQEAVDSLFDNSRKVNAVKTEGNRALKSLSDILKGKQGRFRQNLLGKRVDYSARSVIVVGPNLKLHECGLPKDMAAELFKPFIIRKMIERGVVKTVKSAKKIVDRKDPLVWDILENVLKGHPVLLNRAPTLHRLGIQAFQPKLVEGKAIQLHPLTCTAFNADFDGDQMAVHVPLGNAAILEAQVLMLASHNILNPANGTPITVPSQDMVLGLYYITKGRKTDEGRVVKGQDLTFYSSEEVIIAYNERKIDLHAFIKVKGKIKDLDGIIVSKIIETTVGRVLFNQHVPEEVGYINELLTKKSLRDIIGEVVKITGMARAAQFLDDIKELGFRMAFQGGLSFNLKDINIPEEKVTLIAQASKEVEDVMGNYNMGFITNNERYNQIIDIWTRINNRLTANVMNILSNDNQGFNSVYMMLDSGARGSKEQIRQLAGMRGLMAKPQKSGSGGEIIENPILSNFKEGLSVLEYFISTHGARKGLADTALKTADAGYLTRRLHDVAQDMIVGEVDCGTLRGIYTTALKDNEDVVEPLYDRILGRTTLHDVHDPITNELLIKAGEDITEEIAKKVENSPLEGVEIRSVLTCESKRGVCALCYGRNLASGKRVQMGEAVGVIAAQSIGEPGTQLTLRTFHVGGTASNIAAESQINAKFDGVIEFENVRTVEYKTEEGIVDVVLGRSGEFRIIEAGTNKVIVTNNIPYGSYLYVKDGANITKGDRICSWDPYNAVIISEFAGITTFEAVLEGITFREESDEQTGHREKVIIDTRDKTKNPVIQIADTKGNIIKGYNIPVGAHISVEEGEKLQTGQVIAKIPRSTGKTRDITGGLPRVTELFEARNPSNPAVVTEIDGVVTLGGVKRGNREMTIESKDGQVKKYLVPLSKHILVQDNDFVKAGMPLSDGSISPADILAIKGPAAVQEYLVNGIQEVYRLQGVKINDKHFEVIVHQMMQKVAIEDAGDTRFLEREAVDSWDFMTENDEMFDKKVVVEPGDSASLKAGQIISLRKLRDENSILRRKDLALVEVRDAIAATSSPMLQGITRASLGTKSFISAASFQETTKVLNEAAIAGKKDLMLGLKENVIVGHLIPSGTGLREYENIRVGSQEEFDRLMASKTEEVEA
ncbi:MULTISPECIES: DNA-directed RNA polymerase subunit beta' [unclassified Mucilaginibacter]|uniref:DNA-directed RNA polymerase subunit beta' n=1 Tax=unclassified Mucilaginibacter TaxID=2617802 RepID=UPI002AC8A3D5|nr:MULTISPECIES: DNA-directed RNA polymerase subunit beta' [unclassified Mucilaginibacter]MEB0261757.1 DNA-directed RNA polymerase subunit beta' [Mucilaginibacter sp. 10I4]MEB0277573.1 DNA-directed RNA polymerase subunit beta' [Mucilaginibacter sp. 10B2]MEB0299488.1 DNA-directed RNA polymerase subunit beta' [Mucilaginibacter sp. 5C4]WPX24798.1 DNA-directed RNA polymerase subunit beta' [Mucilaginibacter sp. 5C4]